MSWGAGECSLSKPAVHQVDHRQHLQYGGLKWTSKSFQSWYTREVNGGHTAADTICCCMTAIKPMFLTTVFIRVVGCLCRPISLNCLISMGKRSVETNESIRQHSVTDGLPTVKDDRHSSHLLKMNAGTFQLYTYCSPTLLLTLFWSASYS